MPLSSLLSLEEAIDRQPLMVATTTAVQEVVILLSQSRASCILVVEQQQLVGILTEHDIVYLCATHPQLAEITVGEVMNPLLIILKASQLQNAFEVLHLMRQYQINYLPIEDDSGVFLGVITQQRLQELIAPTDLLQLWQVSEFINPNINHIQASVTVQNIAQRFIRQRSQAIIISDITNLGFIKPIGILTRRDIVQLKSLGLDLSSLTAENVMSTPLQSIQPHESLQTAYLRMQRHHISRLVVIGNQGELQGILTKDNVLQALDPVRMQNGILQEKRIAQQKAEQLRDLQQQLHQQITKRQQAEAALQESESRYRVIVEAQTELVCRFLPNGTLTFVNEAYCRYFNEKRSQLIGQNILRFIPDEDRAALVQHLGELNYDHPTGLIEHPIVLPNGEIHWQQWSNLAIIDDQGNTIEFQSVGRDITQRKQTEIALAQSEEKFRQIAENVREVFWLADPQMNRFIYINPVYEEVFGYSCQSLYDNPDSWLDAIHPQDRKHLKLSLKQQRNSTQCEFDEEYRIIRPDNAIRWIWVRTFAIKNELG
ncbi:MAG: CBS domain-containing protein, partial [Chroococcales cyanobacterium]